MAKSRSTSNGTEAQTEPRSYTNQPVPLKLVKESPTNPRKSHDENGIIELAESMAGPAGLIQPITVRPKGDGTYEIVSGHRRVRAARHIGWETIDAIVREVGDEEVLEIQIIENLQREDVNAMDEALAFQSLLQKQSLDWLCSKIHKSKKYVQDRLKLNELVEEGREWVSKGVLPLTHAIMISKLPAAEQQKCIAKCVEEDYVISMGNDEEVYVCSKTVHELREFIEDMLMIDFDKACFDPKSEDLMPEAGPCTKCPKRTCNQNLLFADLTEEDKCTDAACFQQKVDAHIKKSLREAKDEYGNDKTAAGQFERYQSDKVKVKGVSVPYSAERKKDSDICVVITKEPSDHHRERLGRKVFVDASKLKTTVTKKENGTLNTARGSSYEEPQKHEFIETVWPRMQEIPEILKQCNSDKLKTVSNRILHNKLDELSTEHIAALSCVLGIIPTPETPEEVYKICDKYPWGKSSELVDKIIQKLGERPFHILCVMQLIEGIEDTDKARPLAQIVSKSRVDLGWADTLLLLGYNTAPKKKEAASKEPATKKKSATKKSTKKK